MSEKGLNEELEALRADLSKLRGDVAGIVKTLEESARERAGTVRGALGDLLEKWQEELEGTLGTIREVGESSAKTVAQQVEQRPLLGLLAAFGAGLLLGKILERR